MVLLYSARLHINFGSFLACMTVISRTFIRYSRASTYPPWMNRLVYLCMEYSNYSMIYVFKINPNNYFYTPFHLLCGNVIYEGPLLKLQSSCMTSGCMTLNEIRTYNKMFVFMEEYRVLRVVLALWILNLLFSTGNLNNYFSALVRDFKWQVQDLAIRRGN